MVFGKAFRTPMDADGHFGGCPPKSDAEPELTVGGKVVLIGSSVVRVNKQQRTPTRPTETAENDDERDTAPSKEAQQQAVEGDDSREPSDGHKEGATSSSSWWSWSKASENDERKVVPSERASEDARGEEEKRTSFWGWFGNSTCATPEEQPTKESCIASSSKNTAQSPTLFPWGSAREIETKDENDEDSLGDDCRSTSKLFGDLSSLPSVNGDVTIGGDSLKSTDFDGRDDDSVGRNSALVDKKLKEITIVHPPKSLHLPAVKKTDSPSKGQQARRQALVKELRAAIASHGRYDIRCAAISSALGDLLDESGEYDQAIKLHRDSVTIYSVKLGDQHPTTCDAKVRLASVLANAGEYDEAISNYYAVMAMNKALKGEKDPTVADGLALMANTLRKGGEYNQAIKELKRALKIYRESLGDSHEKVATTVDAIASLYVTLGDFEKSSAILEEVVKLKAATLGMKSKAVAETLTCLAMTYECSEQYALAMKALKRAYKIYTEIGGYASEEATATLSKIALLYEAMGDYNRASIAFLGVLRGRKIHHGEDHLLVGETYCKLGHALRETGQLEKALKCMKEALPIYVGKGVEMNDVEKIAEIMHEMALIYKEKQHFSEASRIFKQELSVRRKIGQPEFPHIARILNLLGVAEYELKNNSRALKYLVEALTIFQDQNEHGTDCAEVLYNTGLVFVAARNKDRALEAFAEAERLFSESENPSSHQFLLNTKREIQKIRDASGSRYK